MGGGSSTSNYRLDNNITNRKSEICDWVATRNINLGTLKAENFRAKKPIG